MKESTKQDVIIYGSWAIEAVLIGWMVWFVHHVTGSLAPLGRRPGGALGGPPARLALHPSTP